MFSMIKDQIIETLKIPSIIKNQLYGLIQFDFFTKERRSQLMRMCFAPLSCWLLFVSFGALYLNPLRYHFSISQMLGINHPIIHILFDSSLVSSIVLIILNLLVSFFLKKEFLLLFLYCFLIAQGDIHINLAVLIICFIFLGRSLYNFKYLRVLEGLSRTTWKYLSVVTFLSHALSIYISINLLRYYSFNGYFRESMYANRFEFYVLAVGIFYGTEILFLALWGHFYNKRILENNESIGYLVKYSTVRLLTGIKISLPMKNRLLNEVERIQLEKSRYSSSDLDLLPRRIVDLHRKEESFLNTAQSALT